MERIFLESFVLKIETLSGKHYTIWNSAPFFETSKGAKLPPFQAGKRCLTSGGAGSRR